MHNNKVEGYDKEIIEHANLSELVNNKIQWSVLQSSEGRYDQLIIHIYLYIYAIGICDYSNFLRLTLTQTKQPGLYRDCRLAQSL